MNYISTELQRRIMFIPLLNLGNFFIAAYNCRQTSHPVAMNFKLCVRAFCMAVPVSLFWSILSSLLPQLEDLFWLCCIYTAPLSMSYGLIKLKEKEFTEQG